MSSEDVIRWVADAELAEMLRRYYGGDFSLWDLIQSHVAVELRARGLPVAPRHMRFLRTAAGYEVIVEGAEPFHSP